MRVALLRPTLPGGKHLQAEECCFGVGDVPTFNSPMGGLYSSLLDMDFNPYYAWSLEDIKTPPYAVVMPLVIGYDGWLTDIAKKVKQRWPAAKLIAFTITQGLAKELGQREPFDHLVGYDTIPELLKQLGGSSDEYFPEIRVQAIPNRPFVPWLLTATGCMARCSYCSWAARPMRWRSPDNTIRSLTAMFNPGSPVVRWPVLIAVAEMNANVRWMREFSMMKTNSPLANYPIVTDVRADWLTEEHVDLLQRMKCAEVIAALESPNKDVLKVMDRQMDPEKYVRGYKMLKEAGIKVMCPILFGVDERESAEEYAAFCNAHGIVGNPGIMKLYAGTPMWERMQKEGWETELLGEWPKPAEPLVVRKGVAVALEKLRKFKELTKSG